MMVSRLLMGSVVVSLVLAFGGGSPAHANSCSAGVGDGGRSLWSFCPSTAALREHRAGAQMYFDSGYSTYRYSPWTTNGVKGSGGIFYGGSVMGPVSIFRR